MLFSVLIPLYNAENYIGECINSILAQTYDDYEIVIVDDGSTDKSSDIVDRYQQKYPNIIRVIHKENSGVLMTRRRLLKEAKGDYIVWVDSDDLIKPELLSDLYHEITSYAPDVIVYNFEFLDNPEKVIHSLNVPHKTIFEKDNKHQIFEKLLLGRDMNELVTKCIKRDIVDVDTDYSKYKHVKMGDDLFCLMPIFDVAKRIEYLDKSYYKYRVVSSSITHINDYKCYYSYRTIFEREESFLSKWCFSSDEISRVKDKFANRIVDCMVSCVKASEINKDKFLDFVNDIEKDEKQKSIFSNGSRSLSSKPYQYFYKLFIKKRYLGLFYSIKLITKISSLIH